MSDNPFDPSVWQPIDGFGLTDITYHRHVVDGVAQPTVRIAFDRPEVRNAFGRTPWTSCTAAWTTPGCRPTSARLAHRQRTVPKTAAGRSAGWRPTHPRPERLPVRGGRDAGHRRPARAGRLHILEVQRLMRFMPKVVICLVNGWAAGGGHSLHVVRRDAGQPRARAVQADRRRCRQLRRRLRQRVSGEAGRAEVRPRDLLPRQALHRGADARDGRGQRGRRPRQPRSSGWSGPRRSTANRRRRNAC